MTEIVEEEKSALIRVDPDRKDIHEYTFDELAEMQAYVLDGFSELDKAELLGVPHIITGVTYWLPKPKQRGFIAVEATIASPHILGEAVRRGWIKGVTDMATLRFSPNERIVYNDGGTGVRRQITKQLQKHGLIDVGHADMDDTRFDLPWTQWNSFSESREQGDKGLVPSLEHNHVGDPLIIFAMRGLSVSEYSNEHTDEGKTYYIR